MDTTTATGTDYRVGINLRRAVACAPGITNPVARHEQFLELVFALSGPGFRRAHHRFLASPAGRQLLTTRPDLVDALTDHDRLRACPPGSLGHAYLDFMSQNRLDAGLYDDTYHDLPAIADRLGWDDDFHYIVQRGIAAHDLMHVLGGYGPDTGGELGVLAFTHGQVQGWVTGGGLLLSLSIPLGIDRRARLRYWREAVARGRVASMLFAAPYEELLDDPLDEVRAGLGVVPDGLAHPNGHLYSTHQFGDSDSRSMDAAFEPYRYDPGRDLTRA